MGQKMLKSCFSSWCQGISPDELKDELPERQPRYPFLSALKRFVFFSGQNFIYEVGFFQFLKALCFTKISPTP